MSKRNIKKSIELCPCPGEPKPIAMVRLPKEVLRCLKAGEPMKSFINFNDGKITFNTNTYNFTRNEPYSHRCIFKSRGSKAELLGEAVTQIRIDYRSKRLSQAAKEAEMLESAIAYHQLCVGDQPLTHDPQRIYKPPAQSRSRAPDHDPSSAEGYLSTHTGVYSKSIPLKIRIIHLLALDKYKLSPIAAILQEDPGLIRQELGEIADEADGVFRLKLSEYLNVDVAGFRGYSHKDRIKATGNCNTAFNLSRLPSNIPQRRALEAFYSEAGIRPYSTPEDPPEEACAKKESKASPKQPQKASSPKPMKVAPSKPAPTMRSKLAAAPSKSSVSRVATRPKITEPDSSPLEEPRVSSSINKRGRLESNVQALSPSKRTKKAVHPQDEAPRAMQRQISRSHEEEPRITQRNAPRGFDDDSRTAQRQRVQEDSRPLRQTSRGHNEDLRATQRQTQRGYDDPRAMQRQVSRTQDDARSIQRTRTRAEESGAQRQPTLNSRAPGLASNDGLLRPKASRPSRNDPTKFTELGSAFRKLNREFKSLRAFFLRHKTAVDRLLDEAKSTSTNESKLHDLTKRTKIFISTAEEASYQKKRARFDELQAQLTEIRKKLNDYQKALI